MDIKEQTDENEAPVADPAPESVEPPAAEPAPAPTFQSSYKYKVLGEEKELPETVRPLIKDADSEKFVRELFEKSEAMEHFKTKHGSLHAEYEKVRQQYEPLMGELTELSELRQAGDLGGFFEKLGLKQEEVLSWAVEQVKQMQLPEDQRRAHETMSLRDRELRELRKANERTQSQMESYLVTQKQREIEMATSVPEVKSFVAAFDERAGRQGAFMEELLFRGDKAFRQGRDLSAQEVVSEIMRLYPMGGQPAAPGSAPKPPVIPNVGGRNGIPSPGSPRNLDDLKKLADSM